MRPDPSELDAERPVLDPDVYLADCFRLARDIWEDGYRPDYLVALWRGGASPGIAIHEFFRYRGHEPYHTAIRTQAMESVGAGGGFDIKGLEHVIDEVTADHRLLLVDDLFDTGRTMFEVIDHLRRRARRNTPEVRVATVYYRPQRRVFLVGPHYWLHECETRPVFPHRLTEMDVERIRALEPELAEALE